MRRNETKSRSLVALAESLGWLAYSQSGSHAKYKHETFGTCIIPVHSTNAIGKGLSVKITKILQGVYA